MKSIRTWGTAEQSEREKRMICVRVWCVKLILEANKALLVFASEQNDFNKFKSAFTQNKKKLFPNVCAT